MTLKVFDRFDSNGEFPRARRELEEIVILESDEIPSWEDNMLWCPSHHYQNDDRDLPLWESILCDAWGAEKYQEVSETMRMHYKAEYAELEKGNGNCESQLIRPTCTDLGVVSGFVNIQEEAFEVIMRKQVPGLLAIANGAIAMPMSSLKVAVNSVNRVLHEVGSGASGTSYYASTHNVFVIPGNMKELALAVIRQKGWKEAYATLGHWSHSDVERVPFFDKERMDNYDVTFHP